MARAEGIAVVMEPGPRPRGGCSIHKLVQIRFCDRVECGVMRDVQRETELNAV